MESLCGTLILKQRISCGGKGAAVWWEGGWFRLQSGASTMVTSSSGLVVEALRPAQALGDCGCWPSAVVASDVDYPGRGLL